MCVLWWWHDYVVLWHPPHGVRILNLNAQPLLEANVVVKLICPCGMLLTPKQTLRENPSS